MVAPKPKAKLGHCFRLHFGCSPSCAVVVITSAGVLLRLSLRELCVYDHDDDDDQQRYSRASGPMSNNSGESDGSSTGIVSSICAYVLPCRSICSEAKPPPPGEYMNGWVGEWVCWCLVVV